MCNVDIRVSERVNTFLFLSLIKKEKEEFDRDDRIKETRNSICEGIKEWERIYKNRLVKVYGWDPQKDRDKIEELSRRNLLFQFKDVEKDENVEYLNFSLPLLGRHDFVHLLEGPNLVEMSSMLHCINSRLEERRLIREILNISGAAMDFRMDGRYFFLGEEEKPWFDDNEKFQERDEIRKDFVYAVVCIEFKKGIKENGKFVELQLFLEKLDSISERSKGCILGMFLGFGLHDLIIILGSRKISEIILTVTDLRVAYPSEENPSIVRDTSTIFSIPEEESEHYKEDCDIEYSTLVSIVAGDDQQVFKELDILRDNKEIHSWLRGEIQIFERQGYYDLIVSFTARSHYHAGLFTTKLYNLKPVLRTSTMVKMKEDKVMEKFESWKKRKRR